ncbi:unnamed protein product [Cuscuta europaea]|uniref:Uncharacterized protein n=1 Tax=Cuscuta europaea TaxID=41803 RepID=A0A9P1E1X9_CUSEU|nr:unnamed protein product [Cuscuta europaea]
MWITLFVQTSCGDQSAFFHEFSSTLQVLLFSCLFFFFPHRKCFFFPFQTGCLFSYIASTILHFLSFEATKAASPMLGKYYREHKKPGFIQFHLVPILVKSMSEDHYVSDEGEIVFYQTDPQLSSIKKQ